VTGKWSSDPADIDNSDASYLVTPDATTFQTQGGDIFSADASGVLGPSLLWNLGVGLNRQVLDAYPQSGDFDTVGHYNYITGESYVNAVNAQYSDRNRDEYRTDLTWFVDNLGGSHEFKVGYTYQDLEFLSHNFTPAGGFDYRDVTSDYWYGDGDPSYIPYVMYENTDAGEATSTGKQNTLYLQDAWKLAPNLTLKLGARYDQVAYQNDIGTEIADLSELQPRIGLAWDITNDAKNVVKASWGRFMHPSATTLPNYARINLSTSYRWRSCSTLRGFTDPQQCIDYVAARAGAGYRYTPGPDGFDPVGWYHVPSADVFGSEPTQIVDDLGAAYADQLIIGFERELFNRSSIELSYVDKTTTNLIEDTCQGNLNGLTMDDADYCSYYVIDNLEGLKRDYQGAIVKFETRAVDWMWLLASYTYSKSEGNLEYSQGGATDYDFCPEHCVNRYGYLSDDRRHRVKLNGYFQLPANFTLGVDAFWSSAFAFTESTDAVNAGYGTEFLEPRGAHRANDNYQVDLSVTYRINLGNVGIELIGSILNTLDSEQTTGVCADPNGCGSYEFADSTAWQNPRRFELGFRVEF
jgi:hypothetical protein